MSNGYETTEQAAERRLWATVATVFIVGVVLAIGSTFVWEEQHPAVEVPLPVATEPHGFAEHEVARSWKWPAVRAEHLRLHPGCEVCGHKEFVEVHHYIPVHVDSSLELSPDNLVTLCGHLSKYDHHLWYAHLGDWKCENRDLRKWIKAIKERKEE